MNEDLHKKFLDPRNPLSLYTYMWFRRGKRKVCPISQKEIDECEKCLQTLKPNQEIICMQCPFIDNERLYFCIITCKETCKIRQKIIENLKVKNIKDKITKK